MQTNVRQFRRRRQLSGWLDDLANEVVDRGKVELDKAVKERSVQIGGDHITQQNWVVDQFRQILDGVTAGTLPAVKASALIESLASSFEQYVVPYGARGAAGAADVRRLANQIKSSLGMSYVGAGGLSAGLSGNLPLILLAVGAFYFFSKGRRR